MTAVEDPEEFVIAAALYAFEKLNYMGMVGQKSMMSIVDKCKPLLIHPNTILSGHSKKLIQSAVKKHGEKWFMIYNKLYRDNLINYLPFKPLNAEEFELVLAEKLTKKQYYYGLSEPGDELSLLKGFRRSKQRILESAAERLEPTLCARELGLTLHTMFITQQDIEGYDSDTDYSSNESNCGDVDGSENENCTGNESDSNSDLSIGIRDRSYIRESSMGKSQSGLATGGQFTTKSGPHTLTPQEPSFGMSYSDGMAQRLDAVGTPIGMSPGYQGNKQSPTVQLSSKTASAIFSKPHAIHKMDGGPEHASNSTPDRFNSSEQFFPNRKKERANSKAEIDCVKIGKYDHKHTILKLVRRKAYQYPHLSGSIYGVGSDGYFLVTSNYYGLLLWNFNTLNCLQFFPSSTTPTNVSSPLIYGQSSTKLAVLSQTFNGIDFHCVENITLTGTLVKHNNILFPTIHAHENNQNKPVGSSSGGGGGDQNYYNLRSLISSVKIIPLNEGFGALFPNSVYGSSNYNTTGHSRSNSSYSNKNVNDSYNNGGLSGISGSHNFVQSTILEKFSFVLLLGYFNGVIDVFLF
ncbi:hypothetical protein AX774_g2064 [Zancudomyces culisetae]|uniref:Phosphatase 2A Regulatory Subunit A helical domain-containing protein n=1 Tax=Zancudomyces culisetae TaxID=1213189 RepID=A0A1R1PTY5_ZANCU|nr:hypothetical protein AX774_g2064 [Zancudomyces culisetae]|eukprot:OMH84411.1 hypothetical protein AX774_g2064 [Zancudomyces culisetae]